VILNAQPMTTLPGEPEVVCSVLRKAARELDESNPTLAGWLRELAGDSVVKVQDTKSPRSTRGRSG